MRSRTPETLELVSQAYLHDRRRQQFSGDDRTKEIRLLQAIGATGEFGVIPDIVPLVCATDLLVAHAAATAIARLLSQALSDDLARLDVQMRERISWGDWYFLKLSDVEQFAALGETSTIMLGIATFHSNGFVRAKAISLLQGRHDGEEVPFLLIRANDWVGPVREAAQQALRVRLIAEYARHFIRHLPLLARLQRSPRGDTSALITEILAFIKGSAAGTDLRVGFDSPDKVVRRMSYQLALASEALDRREVITLALQDGDPWVRIRAAQCAGAVLQGEVLRETLEQMLHERFIPVRRAALQLMAEHFPEMAREHLRHSLCDANSAIREVARYYLRRIGDDDFAAVYRGVLKKGTRLPGAIAGLGETGGRDDAPRLSAFAVHESISVRKAALRAIARLHGEGYIPLFQQALADEAPGVSRAGREALAQHPGLLDADYLADLFQYAPHLHVRRNALRLLACLGKWASLPHLLRATCDSDAQLSALAHRFLQQWLLASNRSFVSPTPRQLEECCAAFAECGHTLEEEERKVLQFELRTRS